MPKLAVAQKEELKRILGLLKLGISPDGQHLDLKLAVHALEQFINNN